MTFTTAKLTNERVLVKGTDRFGTEGTTVLDGSEWAEVQRRYSFTEATQNFDATVEEFFAPLFEATDKLDASLKRPGPDPITYVVFDEGVEGTPSRHRDVVRLNQDSVVLRLIEQGNFDRLVWVLDSLEVMTVEELPEVADLEGGPADDGE